jgi:hypothetical protein
MGVTPETGRSYHRETVILPDGRRITGWSPGAAGGQLLEHRLRDNLATQLGGITEAQLPYGRADVLTKDTVFEVEPAENWRYGVRQVLAYAAQVGLPPAVALFGTVAAERMLAVYEQLSGGQWPPARQSLSPCGGGTNAPGGPSRDAGNAAIWPGFLTLLKQKRRRPSPNGSEPSGSAAPTAPPPSRPRTRSCAPRRTASAPISTLPSPKPNSSPQQPASTPPEQSTARHAERASARSGSRAPPAPRARSAGATCRRARHAPYAAAQPETASAQPANAYD